MGAWKNFRTGGASQKKPPIKTIKGPHIEKKVAKRPLHAEKGSNIEKEAPHILKKNFDFPGVGVTAYSCSPPPPPVDVHESNA